jgi:putative heme-binding domain-containing protein
VTSSRLLLLFIVIASTFTHAAERVPWTASRIHGSPEPPLPYRVERAYPNLTFEEPLDVTTIPGTNRLVVAEHHARIFSFPNDDACAQPDLFADMKQFDPEAAECFSITFHPRFAENRFAFVWINLDTHQKPNRENGTHIVRFRVTDEPVPKLDLGSGEVIFTWLSGGHNGGCLRFGPDGMLYFGAGDSATPDPPDPLATGQDISDVMSSILRIDVDHPDPGKRYGIPKDNPFVTTPGARGEIWAYGLRNPWRMGFDPKNGDLFVGDVGWELWEMIYRIQRGGNYGWSITEGGKQDVRPDRPRGPTPILPPMVVHSHEEAASITGGEFYRAKKLPDLGGAFIYGDWQMGTFWSLRADGDRVTEHRVLCHTSLMPVGFGLAPDNDLLICDFGGGGLWRFVKNPAVGSSGEFPRKLSETGLFTDAARGTPAPGVLPFVVNAQRWADYATSRRWVGFPGTSHITLAEKGQGVLGTGRWVFPEDAVLAKTYSLEMERGNPATSRRVETQIMHFDGQQWGAYSYRWNDAQTDAELVPAGGGEAIFEVKDAAAPDGVRNQRWRFFSRAECLRCHNLWDNFTPGFASIELDMPTPQAAGRQLDAFARLGLVPEQPKLADPYGARGSVETRARSYLHVNCSTCHRFGGGGSVPSFMDIETKLGDAHLLNTKPVQGDLSLPDACVIAPGDPCRSVLLYRMTTAGRGHMPYLGGKLMDDRAVVLVRDWIAGMKPNTADTSAAALTQRANEEKALAQLKAGDASQLGALLATRSGALSVALAVIDGSLKDDARAKSIAAGSALVDPLRRDLFERFLPEAQRRQVLGADVKPDALLAAKGDAARGKPLFAAACAACHSVGKEGTDFGPELTHIATKYDRAGILDQILHPSKIIEPQWQLATITLKDGNTQSGFIATRTTSELTLRIAGGEQVKIPTGNVVRISTETRVSAMPEGLLQSFTAQEAADLLDFLSSLK